jgi:translation initiation factor RLI1
MACPNIEKLKSFIDSMSSDQHEAFLNLSENDRISKLNEAGIDLTEADKAEMIQYLVEHLTTTTDDELMAAAGGEIAKAAVAAASIKAGGAVATAAIGAGATLGAAAIKKNSNS